MPLLPAHVKSLSRRWSDLSLRAKAMLFGVLPMTALLASAALMNRLEARKAAADESLKDTLEIRAQLQNIYIVLIAAESEVRNYGLNRREEGIQPLGMVGASVDAVFTKIGELVHQDQGLRNRLGQAKHLVHERLRGLRELRTYYQTVEIKSMQPPSDDLIARARISPDVLIALSQFGAIQSKLQQERAKDAEAEQGRLRLAADASGLLGLAGGLFAALWLASGVVRRVRGLRQTALHLHEGISASAGPDSNDELGKLASAIQSAGQTIAAQREELKLALEGAGVFIWELKPALGRIRYQTGSGSLLDDSVPAELLPSTVTAWIAVVHSEDRDHVWNELNRITSEGGSFQIEYRVVIRGGELRWMSVKAQSHSVEGQPPERLLGVLADITPQKVAAQKIERQAEELSKSREALQQQTRILQSILDSMGDGVVVADTSGKFVVFNPAARQMLGGYSFVGEPKQWSQHYGLFLPDGITLYPAEQFPLLRAIHGESVDAAEIFVRPAGASEGKWASITATPLREEDGKVKGGVIVMRDITAAKHAAAALEAAKKEAEDANQAKSDFLSRMSHELRTPLNSIIGFAQLLELDELNEQQSDNVSHILKGGYHLLDLINEILDLARIESGRMSLSPEPVHLEEALNDAIDAVRPLAIQKNVSLSADVAVRCDRHVRADRQRLKQVLLNLLSNAIKFNRTGGSVIVSCHETPNRSLRLEVIDTGSGISAESLKKIFKPFERLAADRTDVSGTGLGLALSKRLVEAMGGAIGVESAVGLGSKFFVELGMTEDPAIVLDTEDAAIALRPNGSPRSHRGALLYIEDNASNLKLVEQILSHCPDVKLLSAMQGNMGLDLAELHLPDWILLDVHLPDIPGSEVLRRLQLNPRTRHIPVTVLSADATAGQISRLMEAGARDYLTKPLDVRKLLNLLEATLRNGDFADAEMSKAYAERNRSN